MLHAERRFMSTEATAEVQQSELAQIVESVFETMMSLEVTPDETPWLADASRMTSAVHLTGDWNGTVVFECDRRQACKFAGRFLSMDPPAAVDDDVRDVLGELANMIGGNVKGALEGDIRLSMPSVVDGGDYSVRICGAVIQERLALQCDQGVFWVTKYVTDRKPK
jgi:chemotaxis protein CheX